MSISTSSQSSSLWHELSAGASNLGRYLGGIANPSMRIGVTGLSRSGKSVFITGMVHALISRGRLPAFRAMAEGRIADARLVAHPDDALPRFAYEDHLAMLSAPDRQWPASTRQISALRLELDYQSRRSRFGGLFGPAGMLSGGQSRLTLDIVDYPGEWLLDLPLLAKSYAQWSHETFEKAVSGVRKPLFSAYLEAARAMDARAEASETQIKGLSEKFTSALRACREEGRGLSALAPGRFLMPGDLEGAPALSFAPLVWSGDDLPENALGVTMIRRFEAYKKRVVRPFFTEHFSRLDRQIILVDVLSALNGGRETMADLETAMVDVLAAFNVGANSLLSSLLAPRVSKILFAATKADHLHHSNHDRLEAILKVLVRRAWHRAQGAGSETGALALAAIRATREVVTRQDGQELPCVAGVPMAGEQLDGRIFDGTGEVALFPGDLFEAPERAFLEDAAGLRFLGFRPPVITVGGELPSIRLDRAIEFLIGDQLA